MARKLEEGEFQALLRWQHWMVGLFVATLGYVLLVVAVDLVLSPPRQILRLAIVPALALAVAGVVVQFSARCPACGYRLGRQSRLVVPEHCRRCKAVLRRRESAA